MKTVLGSMRHRVRKRLGADIHEMVTRVTLRHVSRYERANALVSGRAVLDAACGSGYGALLLQRAASYRGLDLDRRAIAEARREFPEFSFIEGSVFELPLPAGSMGAVTSFETLEHIPDPERAIASFAEVLEPGGVLVGSIPINHPDRIYHQRPYSPQEGLDIFASDGRLTVESVHAQHDLAYVPVGVVAEAEGTLFVVLRRSS